MPHVYVIGAGFAGLAAARTLFKKGQGKFHVTILEGSHRVGGRAHTVQLPNSGEVEMGATWFHGTEGNPLYDLAVEHGLINKASGSGWGTPKFVREGELEGLKGQEAAIAQWGIRAYGGVIESLDGINMSLELAMKDENAEKFEVGIEAGVDHKVVSGLSVGQCLRSKLKEILIQSRESSPTIWSENNVHILKEAWGWRETLQRSIEGCTTTDEVCAKNYSEYKELPGPNLPVPSGFQTLAKILAEGIDIKFDHIVSQIVWRNEETSNQVEILCENGERFIGDAVVVSVSLGVLQRNHQELFSPPLPQWKRDALVKLGFGVVDKIFVEFSSGSDNWQQGEEKGVVRDYRLLWKQNNQEISYNGVDNGKKGDSASWQRGVYSWRYWGAEFMRSRMGEARRPSAALWITGNEALEMEKLSEEELRQGCLDILKTYPSISRPQGDNVKMKAYRSIWGIDPLFYGSYSFIKVGSSGKDMDFLFEPLVFNKKYNGKQIQSFPVVSFCGEATSREFFGTAHGAYLSGEKAGSVLANQLQLLFC